MKITICIEIHSSNKNADILFTKIRIYAEICFSLKENARKRFKYHDLHIEPFVNTKCRNILYKLQAQTHAPDLNRTQETNACSRYVQNAGIFFTIARTNTCSRFEQNAWKECMLHICIKRRHIIYKS